MRAVVVRRAGIDRAAFRKGRTHTRYAGSTILKHADSVVYHFTVQRMCTSGLCRHCSSNRPAAPSEFAVSTGQNFVPPNIQQVHAISQANVGAYDRCVVSVLAARPLPCPEQAILEEVDSIAEPVLIVPA